ncbi:hypothetical protein PVAR5_3103 [Paecilomyces variotii No. 5]|uniref:Uncharacterized protein n=1 Tax=Byssochlamys spectabilis (strain No. 5 / NBRC 109023) TaxID=1356009 RepID=V5G0U7_BYSSN|nr:hypothetical protein PVAR5_3103 [Paecilomyces variotii No. 5]
MFQAPTGKRSLPQGPINKDLETKGPGLQGSCTELLIDLPPRDVSGASSEDTRSCIHDLTTAYQKSSNLAAGSRGRGLDVGDRLGGEQMNGQKAFASAPDRCTIFDLQRFAGSSPLTSRSSSSDESRHDSVYIGLWIFVVVWHRPGLVLVTGLQNEYEASASPARAAINMCFFMGDFPLSSI